MPCIQIVTGASGSNNVQMGFLRHVSDMSLNSATADSDFRLPTHFTTQEYSR